MQGEPEEVAKALALGDIDAATQAGLEPSRRALLELAGKLTRHAYKITAEDTEALRRHGYSDEQIAEAVYDATLFNFLNKVADAFGIKGNGRLEMPYDTLAATVAPRFRSK